MTEEDIEALAIEHADNKSLSGTHIWVVSKLSFMDGYKAASKEEVSSLPSIDEAGAIAVKIADNIEPNLTDRELSLFVAGFQECTKWLNYTLIPKNQIKNQK
jgi:hypothetical protein